jgi:hypothetical protein
VIVTGGSVIVPENEYGPMSVYSSAIPGPRVTSAFG